DGKIGPELCRTDCKLRGFGAVAVRARARRLRGAGSCSDVTGEKGDLLLDDLEPRDRFSELDAGPDMLGGHEESSLERSRDISETHQGKKQCRIEIAGCHIAIGVHHMPASPVLASDIIAGFQPRT